jgi:hypothetical protein
VDYALDHLKPTTGPLQPNRAAPARLRPLPVAPTTAPTDAPAQPAATAARPATGYNAAACPACPATACKAAACHASQGNAA